MREALRVCRLLVRFLGRDEPGRRAPALPELLTKASSKPVARFLTIAGLTALLAGTSLAADNKTSYSSEEDGKTHGNQGYVARRPGPAVHGARSGSAATTTYFLHPGACAARYVGSWSALAAPVADSLNSYTAGQFYPYMRTDLSSPAMLWHADDGAESTVGSFDPVLSGSRSLWCGRGDSVWVVKNGYPNATYQILYLDTGTHAGTYTLSLQMLVSVEKHYDFLYLIGGGAGTEDPLGNTRSYLDDVVDYGAGGPGGDSDLLVAWTGSIRSGTPGAASINTLGGPQTVTGAGGAAPEIVTASITIAADHRGLYFVLKSDPAVSSEDGAWPFGNGLVLDNIATSDNGTLYANGDETGGSDAHGGSIIAAASTPQGDTDGVAIAARVPAGVGAFWRFAAGNSVPLQDACSPQKQLAGDLFFHGTDPLLGKTLDDQHTSIVTCTFPLAADVGLVAAQWSEYRDLPTHSGFVQFTEYRVFREGRWSRWWIASPSGTLDRGARPAWITDREELVDAARADSVQLRLTVQCIPTLSVNRANCAAVSPAILYDDLRLEVTAGIAPAPTIGIFPGSVAQSTFVDGTMTGTNCATAPCWPGARGTDLQTNMNPDVARLAIKNNWNSGLGDSITVTLGTGIRSRGMGINWLTGFDRSSSGGLTIVHTNGAFNSSYDVPRMIFRLYDPMTKTWSPFDSTALDANYVHVSTVLGTPETTVVDREYRVDWPPRDKADQNLPGGFSIGGVTAYSSLAFLPRGTRMQYYFKAVDVLGAVTYSFSSDSPSLEVENLPTLPGGAVVAPDILEWQVLPGVYAPGPTGTLLAGSTSTPLLNLDGAYSAWSAGFDPVTQALRGLGVRADRLRLLQGMEEGANVGGHEEPGGRPGRLGNYFPNRTEYGIKDSLAVWYRMMIQSAHLRPLTVFEEQDAALIRMWAQAPTGANGGDRCIFASGDDFFADLLSTGGVVTTEQNALASQIFGVAAVGDAWSGTAGNSYPTIDDRFAAPGTGPGLAAPNTFTYPVDGGCPIKNRFDSLTKQASPAVVLNAAYYPGGVEVAAVATMREYDVVTDYDRTKAIGYGYSIQFVRKTGVPTSALNYVTSGAGERMQILYRFLTSCRGPRTGAPADTGTCWPCPTDADMTGNWSTLAGFQTGAYGPLYKIQNHFAATGVGDEGPAAIPFVNALHQNRPNPFNPRTTIAYSVAAPGRVVIRIYNVAGRLIHTLLDAQVPLAGNYAAVWDGRTESRVRASSGMYFYRITYPDGSVSAKKMTLLR